MFLGHYGVALAAKRAAPRASLATLFIAAQFLDLLWPILLIAGVEHVRIAPGITRVSPLDFYDYPISHSLVTALGFGALVGAIYFALQRKAREALIVGALVPSHWLLDLIVHRPDLPLTPTGKARLGLGAWNSFPLTLALELGVFGGGLAIYLRATRAETRAGSWGLAALAIALVGVYAGAGLGPPPPSETMLAWSGLGLWLFPLAAYFVDRRRASAAA
jgi:hypothetical protein